MEGNTIEPDDHECVSQTSHTDDLLPCVAAEPNSTECCDPCSPSTKTKQCQLGFLKIFFIQEDIFIHCYSCYLFHL